MDQGAFPFSGYTLDQLRRIERALRTSGFNSGIRRFLSLLDLCLALFSKFHYCQQYWQKFSFDGTKMGQQDVKASE